LATNQATPHRIKKPSPQTNMVSSVEASSWSPAAVSGNRPSVTTRHTGQPTYQGTHSTTTSQTSHRMKRPCGHDRPGQRVKYFAHRAPPLLEKPTPTRHAAP